MLPRQRITPSWAHKKIQSSISIGSDYEDEEDKCENDEDENVEYEEEEEEEEPETSQNAIASLSPSSSLKSQTIEYSSYYQQHKQEKLKNNDHLDLNKKNIFNNSQTNSSKNIGKLCYQKQNSKSQDKFCDNISQKLTVQTLHSDNDLNCKLISSLNNDNLLNKNNKKQNKNEKKFQTNNRRNITDTGFRIYLIFLNF